jgi:predicted O-methyltransferase YrrM
MLLPQVLEDIYATNKVIGPDGRLRPTASQVVRENAEALFNVVRSRKPKVVLEVGMAYGATALAATAALEANGIGRMISIDPFQSSEWNNIGVLNMERAGLAHLHELIEAFDYEALPRLLADDTTIGVAYIDGLHSFEYALLDFFYVDKMMPIGGVVGFNDCDWVAVLPTLRFVEHHRKYLQLDVGLSPRYGNRNELAHQYRRIERHLPTAAQLSRFTPIARALGRRCEDRYYEKLGDWEPPEGWTASRLRFENTRVT